MKITQLNHVAIHVADLDRSVQFYRDILKLEPMHRPDFGFPGAWFRIGGPPDFQELHLIGRQVEKLTPPRERHFAFMIDDSQAWADALRNQGISFTGPKARPDGALQIFLRDPDDHVIELCTPATA